MGKDKRTEEQRQANSEKFANISEADLTPEKAKKILKDGEAKGKPAGGEKPRQ